MKMQIVRVPHTYRFDAVDVREDEIITMWLGYLDGIGFDDYDVHDFHLDRSLTFEETVDAEASEYVISVRETGDEVHYLQRYVRALRERVDARVFLYGQTARLSALQWPSDVHIVQHDERLLAKAIGIRADGPAFTEGLTCRPYAHLLRLQPWQQVLWRGTLETTRGCHYPCRFCFINSGDNYPKQWQVRPNERVLDDLRRYRELGITSLTFYDSEFLGAARSGDGSRRELLRAIRDELPGTQFMIWCRADTLLAFNDFELLKEAGLVNVFIGVESFDQGDLDALNKRIRAADVIHCIERLRELDIHVNMSFMTFNRNTSPKTLRHNLEVIEGLMRVKPRLLGLPHFNFTFESSWDENVELKSLSKRTYMAVDVMMRTQQADGCCWDQNLEPLMELYRLLKYEWSRKVTELTMARLEASGDEHAAIEHWFSGLGMFCLGAMREYLDLFEKGQVTYDRLPTLSHDLFSSVRRYYQCLPESLRALTTQDDHALKLDYDATRLVEDDQYWAGFIPGAPVEPPRVTV